MTKIIFSKDGRVQRSQPKEITKALVKTKSRKHRHSIKAYGRWYKYQSDSDLAQV